MALRTVTNFSWKRTIFARIYKQKSAEYLAGITSAGESPFVRCHRGYMNEGSPSSEETLAFEAAKRSKKDEPNIFQKILSGQVEADTVYQDEQCMAFRDVNPVAPTHIIIIPRKNIPRLSESSDEDSPLLGHLLSVARKVAATQELTDGFRIVMNDGRHGSQSIYHLHVHVIGGRQMRWPPG